MVSRRLSTAIGVSLTHVNRFYIVSEFVLYPKKGSASRKGGKGKTAVKELEDKLASVAAHAASQAGSNGVIPNISTAPSGTDTPDSPTGAPGSPTMGNSDVDSIKRAAALRARAVRPDGGVVCCLAVFEYCFKIGRVTIPPVSFRLLIRQPAMLTTRAAHRSPLLPAVTYRRGQSACAETHPVERPRRQVAPRRMER